MSEQNKFKPYTTHLSKSSLNLVAENEEEEKLLKEMEKALINKIKRLKSKKHNVNIESDEVRDTQTLKKVTDEYIKFKQNLKYSSKRMYKFTQSVEFLIIFFGEKKLVKDFTSKDNVDFQMFLLSIPSDWKRKKALADKDLKRIYDKSPKIFDEYEKISMNTANEIVSNVIAMFEFFKETNYIYTNQFKRLPSIIKRESTQKREFNDNELKKIFFYLKNEELMEEYRYMKFLLYTGLRREEGLIITKNDILWEKYLIEIDGTKTENARRICIIHKDLIDDLEIQLTGKNDDDYLFFNLDLTPQYRSDKVGNKLNDCFKKVLGVTKSIF